MNLEFADFDLFFTIRAGRTRTARKHNAFAAPISGRRRHKNLQRLHLLENLSGYATVP